MKVLLATHDAGGAEILSAWYRENCNRYDCICCLGGPALKIFERDHQNLNLVDTDAVALLNKEDWVLTGTSLESSLERHLIKSAKSSGIHCVTFLDHWDLYEPRFETNSNGKFILPDELWVGDEYALKLAKHADFKTKIILKKNPYFSYIKKEAADLNKTISADIVYIGETVSVKLKETFGPDAEKYDDELLIMHNFLNGLSEAEFSGTLKMRLHPREARDKYDTLFNKFRNCFKITVADSTESLLENIMEAKVVVGVESMGLVIAHILGKKVFSFRTGKAWSISLPFKEIISTDSVEPILNMCK